MACEVPAVVPSDIGAEAGDAPLYRNWALLFARALLGAQFVWFVGFSWVEFHRGALTRDFSMYNQATWMIAHGHIDPYDTVMALRVWRNNGEFILWPLSLLTYLPPEGQWLLWAQDVAVVATGWVAVAWAAEVFRGKARSEYSSGVLLAAILWVANPQVYATAAFDVHTEVFGACFAVLAGRELWRGRTRRAWCWLTLVLGCGFVTSSYAVALGAVVLVSGRGISRARAGRRVGGAMIVVALGWMTLLEMLHGNLASGLASKYGYLDGGGHIGLLQIATGALWHPSRVFRQLWVDRNYLWTNLAPSGLLGLLTPWGLFMSMPVTFADALVGGTNFYASVGFQNFPAFAFVVFGTVVIFGRLVSTLSSKWLGGALVGCVLLWAGTSGGTTLATYPSYWLAVSPRAARVLTQVRARIPAGAEVIASQGISGWFSSRTDVQVVMGLPYEVAMDGRAVYFVLSPTAGLQTTSAANTLALRSWLVRRGARVLVDRDGVWLLRLDMEGGARSLLLPGASSACNRAGGSAKLAGGCYWD